jgi:phosphinothricin acetyltransferase
VVTLRRVRAEDAAAIAALYRPYVTDTRISFELEPPGAAEMAGRIANGADIFPWLVAEDGDGMPAGYAYATRFRARPAYRFAVETTIYLAPAAQGRGIGRQLYGVLLDILTAQGFVHAIGAVTLPNPASVALHTALGFTATGSYPHVGYKQGQWTSVGLFHKPLMTLPDTPAEPLALSACPAWRAIPS